MSVPYLLVVVLLCLLSPRVAIAGTFRVPSPVRATGAFLHQLSVQSFVHGSETVLLEIRLSESVAEAVLITARSSSPQCALQQSVQNSSSAPIVFSVVVDPLCSGSCFISFSEHFAWPQRPTAVFSDPWQSPKVHTITCLPFQHHALLLKSNLFYLEPSGRVSIRLDSDSPLQEDVELECSRGELFRRSANSTVLRRGSVSHELQWAFSRTDPVRSVSVECRPRGSSSDVEYSLLPFPILTFFSTHYSPRQVLLSPLELPVDPTAGSGPQTLYYEAFFNSRVPKGCRVAATTLPSGWKIEVERGAAEDASTVRLLLRVPSAFFGTVAIEHTLIHCPEGTFFSDPTVTVRSRSSSQPSLLSVDPPILDVLPGIFSFYSITYSPSSHFFTRTSTVHRTSDCPAGVGADVDAPIVAGHPTPLFLRIPSGLPSYPLSCHVFHSILESAAVASILVRFAPTSRSSGILCNEESVVVRGAGSDPLRLSLRSRPSSVVELDLSFAPPVPWLRSVPSSIIVRPHQWNESFPIHVALHVSAMTSESSPRLTVTARSEDPMYDSLSLSLPVVLAWPGDGGLRALAVLSPPIFVVSAGFNGEYSINLTAAPRSSVSVSIFSEFGDLTMEPSFVSLDPAVVSFPHAFSVRFSVSGSPVSRLPHSIRHEFSSADPRFHRVSSTPSSLLLFFSDSDAVPASIRQLAASTAPCAIPCAAGSFPNVLNDECIPCPRGFFCPGACANPSACPAGTSSTDNAASLHDCSACSAPSTFAPEAGSAYCLSCPLGSSCTSVAASPCREGSYGIGGECLACFDGFYSVAGSSSCSRCPDGSQCKGGIKSSCPAGSSSSSCAQCPAGFECSSAAISKCPQGTFSPEGWVFCIPCPPGSACYSPLTEPSGCPPGTFSIGGQDKCTPCSSGYYSDSWNQTSCHVCPLDYMCFDAAKAPVACAAGFVTPSEGSTNCVSCPLGSYKKSGFCEACPAGKYCPGAGKLLDCPAGTISQNGFHTSCSVCPDGYLPNADRTSCDICTVGSICFSGTQLSCPAGHFASRDNRCVPCPAGHYCPAGASLPVRCAAGQYSFTGADSCLSCPAGFSCEAVVPRPCGLGSYGSGGVCVSCPEGFACSSTAVLPQCPAGSYSALGDSSCHICPPLFSCPAGAALPIPCPTGTTSTSGSSSCVKCSDGCMSVGGGSVSAATANCSAGMYFVDKKGCVLCSAGSYCKDSVITVCAAGQYSLQGQSACSDSPAGFYLSPGKHLIFDILPCLIGFYSAASATACTACASGHACAKTDSFTSVACSTGTYSIGSQSECTPCPAGFSCSLTAITGSCAPGQYSPLGSAVCAICPAGSFCPSVFHKLEILCATGRYSTGGESVCHPCPAGNRCSKLAVLGNCAAGTYSLENEDACSPCPVGFFCRIDGYISPCVRGQYSSSGSCVDCPAGSFCPFPSGSAQSCPSGKYSLKNSEFCALCPAGYSCVNPGALPQICPQGTYSSVGVNVNCQPCRAGFLCHPGSTEDSPPTDQCPEGAYCSVVSGAVKFTQCPAGTYGPKRGATSASSCLPCPAGRVCGVQTSLHTLQPCPTGGYCPGGNTPANPTLCVAGTYNPILGATEANDCLPCPAGFFCALGSSAPANCPQGSFCPYQSSIRRPCPVGTFGPATRLSSELECVLCPAGSHCTIGSLFPVSCSKGSYSPIPGAGDNCIPCDAGYYCPQPGQTRAIDECPLGAYCPQGVDLAIACPEGTYNDQTKAIRATDCRLCPAGHFCEQSTVGWNGGSIVIQLCSEGYFCPPGTSKRTRRSCPAGTMNAVKGLSHSWECQACPKGFFCPEATVVPSECPSNHFCPGNATSGSQYPCPAGSHTTTKGSESSSICEPCPAGHYCPSGQDPIQCPEGTYRSILYGKKQSDVYPEYSPLIADDYCSDCPGGSFCGSKGLTAPAPCGRGKYSEPSQTTCKSCRAGFYCPVPTVSLFDMLTLYRCPAGLYCPAGLDRIPSNEMHACPTGRYCPEAVSNPIECPGGTYRQDARGMQIQDCQITEAGYYSEQGASVPTGECAPGYYCPAGSTVPTQRPCPAGSYNQHSLATDSSYCMPCPSGSYCPSNTADPILCTLGHYCIGNTSVPEPCPLGTFGSNPGLKRATNCLPCPAGKYCDGIGLTSYTGLCSAGYLCYGGSYTSDPQDSSMGGLCPAGGYCPEGTDLPNSCPPGKYNNYTGAGDILACYDCPPGFYCEGSNTPEPTGPCEAGYYCPGGAPNSKNFMTSPGHYTPEGSSSEIPCPLGTYTGSDASPACAPCDAGRYCNTQGLSIGIQCSKGNYCPKGSIEPTPCPAGTTGNSEGLTSAGECTPCIAGHYCQGVNQSPCNAGYFCGSGAAIPNPQDGVSGDICPAGHYCVAGSSSPAPCPEGTYYPGKGLAKEEDCLKCSPGYYCSDTGNAAPVGRCSAGYYCSLGSPDPAPPSSAGNYGPCSAGFMCPEGTSVQVPCAPGSFSNASGLASCFPCPPGFSCSGSSTIPGPCIGGHYCPLGTGLNYLPCPAGRYSAAVNLVSDSECTLCPEGKACPIPGTVAPSESCSPGFYCPPGSVNVQGATSLVSPTATLCPAGFFCDGSTAKPQSCPIGTYSALSGLKSAVECTKCDPGFFCSEKNATTPTGLCQPGFFCPQGSTVMSPAGSPCTSGNYCPEGSAAPIPCPTGTYNTFPSKSNCTLCTEGSYCDGGIAVPQQCLPGYYCPVGTRFAKQYPCLPGTFQQSGGAAACTPCSPGQFCRDLNLMNPSGPCSSGYYCTSSAKVPNPIDGITGNKCGFGDECPTGSSQPILCGAGLYCRSGSTIAKARCYDGFYCRAGSDKPNPLGELNSRGESMGNICPAGHLCFSSDHAIGPVAPVPCPIGTYYPGQGNSLASCLTCPAGKLCDKEGLETPGTNCPEGYYCPVGNGRKEECPSGHYCPAGLSSALPCAPGTYQPNLMKTSCLPCAAGFYCEMAATEAKPCEAGHYCPANTFFPTWFPCQPGTYVAGQGKSQPTDCIACEPGKYCRDMGMSDLTSFNCPAGYYCKSGVSSAAPNDSISDPFSPSERGGSICPPGYYCPIGSASPFPAAEGTFLPDSGSVSVSDQFDCTPGFVCRESALVIPVESCPEGFFCPGGVEPVECPEGFFCVEKSAKPALCPPGTTSVSGSAWCSSCPAGSFCSVGPLGSTVGLCPAGFYCPDRTRYATEFPCPVGMYNHNTGATSQGDCLPCTAGFACPLEGMSDDTLFPCEAGHFCQKGSYSQTPVDISFGDSSNADLEGGGLCPPGHYCPAQSDSPFPCPEGTFSGSSGLRAASECAACPPGHSCPGAGLSSPGPLCEAGYFCSGGVASVSRVNECDLGFYCPVGSSAPKPCPPGTYNLNTGSSECLDCPSGFFCPQGTSEYSINRCPKGFYCPKHTSVSTQFPCPIGTYSTLEELQSEQDCLPCPSGYFCPYSGQSTIPGDSQKCKEGYYCMGGSYTPQPIDPSPMGGLCPKGSYCLNGTADPTPCPAGTFSSSLGLSTVSQCQNCVPGFVCSTPGLVSPVDRCPSGFYCPQGTIVPNLTCGRGQFCPQGSKQPQWCPPGQFQELNASDTCQSCDQGFYCDGKTMDSCPAGYYCPTGTKYKFEYPCPVGTYLTATQSTSDSDCVPCSAGHYCPHKAMSVAPDSTLECSSGFFCLGRVSISSPMDIILDPSLAVEGGGICPPGKFCPKGISTPRDCPAGTFSSSNGNAAETDCYPCPPGSICATAGLAAPSAPCPEGFFCPGGNADSLAADPTIRPTPCSVGHYCPPGSGVQTKCPAGMYQSSESKGECIDCLSGFFCPEGTSQPLDCPSGYFCPERTGSLQGKSFPCPVGTYSSMKGLTSVALCTLCETGKYCSGAALAAPTSSCAAGWFCPEGSIQERPFAGICPKGHYCPSGTTEKIACPSGSFGPSIGGQNQTSCLPCLPGTQCTVSGLESPDKTCPEQYYCPGDGSTLDCDRGSYCHAGSPSPVPCSPGEFQDDSAQSSCKTCAAGFYCEGEGSTSAFSCSQGYFCPSGSFQSESHPCPAGSFSDKIGLSTISECRSCTSGQYCATAGLSSPSGPCLGGFLCPNGSSVANKPEYLCPAGAFCVEGTDSTRSCPAGSFAPGKGTPQEDACLPCPPGSICAVSGLVSSLPPCAAGKYCPSGSIEGVECPVGSYCPMGSSEPLLCAAGQTTLVTSQDKCSPCPSGYYCDPGVAPVECQQGYFCPSGSDRRSKSPCPEGTYNNRTGVTRLSDCSPCRGGSYCDRPGLVDVTGPCLAGFFCVSGAVVAAPTDSIPADATSGGAVCPQGYYCPQGSARPLPCPSGTFSQAKGLRSSDECLPCPAGFICGEAPRVDPFSTPCPSGYFCSGGISMQTPDIQCPEGSFCPAGSHSPVPCLPGTFSKAKGQQACSLCTAGFYCPEGSISPVPCPPGSYCPAGSRFATEFLCPSGTFDNIGSRKAAAECSACTEAFYCTTPGLVSPSGPCLAGFFCPAGTVVPTKACPPGFYCPEGVSKPVPCPVGTYSPSANNVAVQNCLACAPSFVCGSEGAAMLTTPCPAGYYCPGENKQTPCSQGARCRGGNLAPEPCPAGQYQDELGAASCKPCEGGFHCPQGSRRQVICPRGFFCPPGTGSYTQYPCPRGTYGSSTGLTAPGDCVSCPAGSFCDKAGSSSVSGQCKEGFVCFSGSVSPTPLDGVSGSRCAPGHYCPKGTSRMVPCPSGTFSRASGNTKADNCITCTAGYSCPDSGTVVPSKLCPPGYYCSGDQSTPIQCTTGHYCPEGSVSPHLCPDGFYQDETGRSDCKECLPGSVCHLLSTTANPCPSGFYCDGGSSLATMQPCPPGTFSNIRGLSSASQCTPCPVGRYCAVAGLTSFTGSCAAGYFCKQGNVLPNPSASENGGLCDAGFYCGEGSSDPRQNACPKGRYCSRGTHTPLYCPPGSYSNATRLAACFPCPSGFFCPGQLDPQVCPIRSFCPSGSVRPTLCPAGSYSDATGLAAPESCAACPAGKFCVDGTITGICAPGYLCLSASPSPRPENGMDTAHPFGPCPVGKYCPEGTKTAINCPSGKYSSVTHCRSEDDCGACPRGYLCAEGNPVPAECPSGYYCPPLQNIVIPCPEFTFNPKSASYLSSDCLPCPPGSFCNVLHSSSSGIQCPEGFVCALRENDPEACPSGTFRSSKGGQSFLDCDDCPAGFFCPMGTADFAVHPCSAGYFCPQGSSLPTACHQGFYCPAGSEGALLCPPNYYCLSLSAEPVACPLGSYCPTGSSGPFSCPLGYYSIEVNASDAGSGLTPEDFCRPCPPGTYSVGSDDGTCLPCSPGYICLGRTNSRFPMNMDTEFGYPCPQGFYCPEGSAVPIPCPSRTFNGAVGASSPDLCSPCAVGFYNDQIGQGGCTICPASTTSEEGALQCFCRGLRRVFSPIDGYCTCPPTFQFLIEGVVMEGDGSADCVPIVYDICPPNRQRNHEGRCVDSSSYCKETCADGGRFDTRSGLCGCVSSSLRSESAVPRALLFNNTHLVLRYDSDEFNSTDNLAELPVPSSVRGRNNCPLSGGCKLISVLIRDGGFVATDSPLIFGEEGASGASVARELQESSLSTEKPADPVTASVKDPAVCLSPGDGILVQLSDGYYPAYDLASVLNSNPNFDAGNFRNIATESSSSSAAYLLQLFADAGVYVIKLKRSGSPVAADRFLVVTVAGAVCQNPIEVRSQSFLRESGLEIGALNLKPDWLIISLVIAVVHVLIAAVILAMFFYRLRNWGNYAHDRATRIAKQKVKEKAKALIGISQKKHEQNDAIDKRKSVDEVNLQSLMQTVQNHDQTMKEKYRVDNDMLSGILQVLEADGLAIRSMISNLNLDLAMGSDTEKSKSDKLLELIRREFTARNDYLDRLYERRQHLEDKMKLFGERIQQYQAGLSDAIVQEMTENAQRGHSSSPSETLHRLKRMMADMQNHMRMMNNFIKGEEQRRASMDPLFTTVLMAPISSDMVDEISRMNDEDRSIMRQNAVKAAEMLEYEKRMHDLAERVDVIEATVNQGFIENRNVNDVDPSLVIGDLFRRDFAQAMDQLQSLLSGFDPGSICFDGRSRIDRLDQLTEEESKRQKESASEIFGKGVKEFGNISEIEQKHLKENRKNEKELEREKNRRMKELMKVVNIPALQKDDANAEELEKKALEIEMEEGLSEKLKKRLLKDLETDKMNCQSILDLENRKQEEMIKSKLLKRDCRRMQLLKQKQQAELRAAKLKQLQDAQQGLVQRGNELREKLVERIENLEEQELVDNAVVDSMKQTDGSEAHRAETALNALHEQRKKLHDELEQRMAERIDQIQTEYDLREEQIRQEHKRRIEAERKKRQIAGVDAPPDGSDLDEAVALLQQQELMALKQLEIEKQAQVNDASNAELEDFQADLDKIQQIFEHENSRLIGSITDEKKRQQEKLKSALESRKVAAMRRRQKQQETVHLALQRQHDIELGPLVKSLEEIEEAERVEAGAGGVDVAVAAVAAASTALAVSPEEEAQLAAHQRELEELKQKQNEEYLKEKQRLEAELAEEESRLARDQADQIQGDLTKQMATVDATQYEERMRQNTLKLEKKKAANERRLLNRKRKQESEYNRMLSNLQNDIEQRLRPRVLELEKNEIEQLISSGGISDDRISSVINITLRKRHDQEQQELQARHFKERVLALQSAFSSFAEEKTRQRLELLSEMKRGNCSEDEMNERFDAFEQESLQHQKDLEERVNFEHRKTQENELNALEQRHLEERLSLYKELIPGDLLEKAIQDNDRALQSARQEIEEATRKEINSLKEQMETEKKDLEQQKQSEIEELERENQERLEKQKREYDTKMEQLKDELRKKQEAEIEEHHRMQDNQNNETLEQIQKRHADDLATMDETLHGEKNHQFELLAQKLQIRTARRMKIKERHDQLEKQKKQTELMMVQRQLEEEMERERQQQEHVRDMLKRTMIAKPALTKMIGLHRARKQERERKKAEEQQRLDRDEQDHQREQEIEEIRRKKVSQMQLVCPEMLSKITDIEKRLANISSVFVSEDPKATSSQLYLDVTDTSFATEGVLQVVSQHSLDSETQTRLAFGQQLAMMLDFVQENRVTIVPAVSLPHNRYHDNTYSNSFYFEPGTRKLYIRLQRCQKAGEFMLVLCHCLAHIKLNPTDLSNDSNPSFIAEFFRYIKVYGQELFRKRQTLLNYESKLDHTGLSFDFSRFGTAADLESSNDLLQQIRFYAPQSKYDRVLQYLSIEEDRPESFRDPLASIASETVRMEEERSELVRTIDQELAREREKLTEQERLDAEHPDAVFPPAGMNQRSPSPQSAPAAVAARLRLKQQCQSRIVRLEEELRSLRGE